MNATSLRLNIMEYEEVCRKKLRESTSTKCIDALARVGGVAATFTD